MIPEQGVGARHRFRFSATELSKSRARSSPGSSPDGTGDGGPMIIRGRSQPSVGFLLLYRAINANTF